MATWAAAILSNNRKAAKRRHHNRKIRTKLFRTVALAQLLAVLVCGETPQLTAVRNFGQVDATVWRGAAPSDVALKELSTAGVERVIDLRESGKATYHEAQVAKSLHMLYVNVPFPPMSAPTAQQVQTVITLLNSGGKTFVHCRRGKDRTGVVIACYRMQHDGWSHQQALDEAIRFGMSGLQRSMRGFIGGFSPLPTAGSSLLAVQP
jgi:tyrosine-protein phosphatase SIW14